MLPEQGTTRSAHIFIRLSVQNKHSEFGIADLTLYYRTFVGFA
jgi:hypothetical protein